MKKIVSYRFIVIFLILALSILNVHSPFSFLHYENPPFLFYFLITFTIAFIYLFPTTKFIVAEKILYSFLVTCIALFFGTYITEIILAPIYGYHPNYDILEAPILLENTLFYFLTNLFSTGLFWVWLKYRKEIYS